MHQPPPPASLCARQEEAPGSRLALWYATNGRRHLPWRQTRDPYAVWLSEVMLQQTQVATVEGRYYQPFLARFPTVEALAAAPIEQVLKSWEGLGYYRRAHHLHRAAGLVAAAGSFPQDAEGWQALPGVGRNTARAVAAFALGLPVAILDANLKRVLARVFALEMPSEADLWQAAEALHADCTAHGAISSYDYNQAMMDIGAMLCTPRSPDCPSCPLAASCIGKAEPLRYPAPKPRKAVPLRQEARLVVMRPDGAVALQPRQGKLLQGLWGFPALAEGASTEGLEHLGEVQHAYTHFRLQAVLWHKALQPLEVELWAGNHPQHQYILLKDIKHLALSKLDHKILQKIHIKLAAFLMTA